MQLSICGIPANGRNCAKRPLPFGQLIHLNTLLIFRQAIFRGNFDFFTKLSEKFFANIHVWDKKFPTTRCSGEYWCGAAESRAAFLIR